MADSAGMPTDRYRVPLDELDAVHVPVEDQVTAAPQPPAEGPLAAEELDRQRLLGVTGAGRLRLH